MLHVGNYEVKPWKFDGAREQALHPCPGSWGSLLDKHLAMRNACKHAQDTVCRSVWDSLGHCTLYVMAEELA
eukprot:scaffold126041_cov15-Tisochrysis_lutea.AAC.2